MYYEAYVQEQYQKGEKPGMFEEPELPEVLLDQAADYTDTAIITINRYSGENHDRHNDGSDHYFSLSQAEQNMVNAVTGRFAHVIVLLNVGAMIDTAWFADNDRIEAALMLWQGGMEGGGAAADLLLGHVVPSGKLVDTCVRSFDDYPSSAGFHESPDYVQYTEDIFVGYRYFETIPGMQERVVYPFGFGLSYTEFRISNVDIFNRTDTIWVSVTVTNIGNYDGKEVIQVYHGAPDGKLTKPAKTLCAFEKTRLLKPGKSETLLLHFPITNMASFDDLGLIQRPPMCWSAANILSM